MEGTACGGGGTDSCPAGTPPCNDPIYVRPVLEYTHAGGNCTVIGGYVYRGGTIPDLYGQYLYGDFCTGTIWSGSRQGGGGFTSQQLPITLPSHSTFGEDIAGELYAGDTDGTLLRVRSTEAYAPSLASASTGELPTRGWTIVTLTGSNLLSSSQVSFGGVPAISTTWVDPNTLRVVAPPHADGTVDITAVNPGGAAPATLTGAVTYIAPPPRVQRQVTPRTVVR
jgi:hypothetical protein